MYTKLQQKEPKLTRINQTPTRYKVIGYHIYIYIYIWCVCVCKVHWDQIINVGSVKVEKCSVAEDFVQHRVGQVSVVTSFLFD